MKGENIMHSLRTVPSNRIRALVVAVLSLWFLVALGGSLLGIFDSDRRPPIPLGAAAILPVVIFAIGYLKWAEFRQHVRASSLRILTLAQTWRVGAVVFLMLCREGVLPGVFALPAGWGDIAIGATAPLVAWAISTTKNFPTQVFVLWNVLGLLDLVMAVTLGILASAGPLGILAGEITTRAMGTFPLSMIPTFFVPLLAILHLIALDRVRYEVAYPSNFERRLVEQSLSSCEGR
ncbi:MAG TPA: hypothetical protein VGL70_23315 [Candidatus Binatia bacterium]